MMGVRGPLDVGRPPGLGVPRAVARSRDATQQGTHLVERRVLRAPVLAMQCNEGRGLTAAKTSLPLNSNVSRLDHVHLNRREYA